MCRLARGQEEQAAEERGEGEEEEGEEERREEAEGGVSGAHPAGWHGGLAIRISQAVPSACGRTFLRAAGGQGRQRPRVPCSLGAALLAAPPALAR